MPFFEVWVSSVLIQNPGAGDKISDIDVFLYKKYFWFFPEITSTSYSPNLALKKLLNPLKAIYSDSND